jgi:hypothetical protein
MRIVEAGPVWISFLVDHEPFQSVVSVVGEAFHLGELTLGIQRIYSGNGTDQVALMIQGKKMR